MKTTERLLVLLGLMVLLPMLSCAWAATAPVTYPLKGDAACTRCHDQGEVKPVLSIYQTRHGVKADSRTPGCQSCHGDSIAHIKNEKDEETRPPVDISFGRGDAAGKDMQVGACVACHRNGQRGHWDGSQHQAAQVACSQCHTAHRPRDAAVTRASQADVCFACHRTERAQAHRLSNHGLVGGKVVCSDCHNPHGSSGPTLMRTGSVNETCTSCHAEKRGPFLWEHQPVTESCVNCHTPHGSNISPLLKVRSPFLCQSCHSGDHAGQINSAASLQSGALTTVNGTAPLASANGRAQLTARNCQNCHVLTHGSNHPAGAKFTR